MESSSREVDKQSGFGSGSGCLKRWMARAEEVDGA
jgi:hypothetical protein